MKPVLLLAPSQVGPSRERRRLDLRHVARTDAIDAADYASVIVLNDGGVDTLRRLQLALALRERHRELPVAVLTYLGRDESRRGAGDLLAGAAGPRRALAELGPELFVELKDEVLSLEYQAE